MASSVSAASVTAATFRPLVDAAFRLTLPTGQTVSATLAEATEHPGHSPGQRPPFSLVFHHSRDAAGAHPAQGMVRIEHEAVGALEVFAVPLQPLGDLARWQVIFG
jgi:hypothetical protein